MKQAPGWAQFLILLLLVLVIGQAIAYRRLSTSAVVWKKAAEAAATIETSATQCMELVASQNTQILELNDLAAKATAAASMCLQMDGARTAPK